MAAFETRVKIAASCLATYMLLAVLSHAPSPFLSPSHPPQTSRIREGHFSRFEDEGEEKSLATARGGRHRGAGSTTVSEKASSPERQECRALFTVAKRGQHWADDGPYASLARKLPSLMTRSEGTGETTFFRGTRLDLMGGEVPYVPCKVRPYNASDLASCRAARSSRGKKTWIAFVSDSNGRQKVHSFLYFLPRDLEYTFFLGDKQITRQDFIIAVYYHRHRPLTFDVFGRKRDTKVKQKEDKEEEEEDKEDKEDEEEDKEKEDKKEDEEKGKEEDKEEKDKEEDEEEDKKDEDEEEKEDPAPEDSPAGEDLSANPFDSFDYPGNSSQADFSIFGLRDSEVPLEAYDLRLTLVWAPLGSRATPPTMKERIRVTRLEEWAGQEVIPDVIVLGFGKWLMLQKENLNELVPYTEAASLLRPLVAPLVRLAARTNVLWWHQSRYRWFNFETENHTPGYTNRKKFWEQELYMNQFRDGVPFIDAWLWEAHLRHTGIWQWDSIVPFNLANFQECHDLRKYGVVEEKVYTGRWWHCRDAHHSSYETNFDEIQMLLNLLCNPYVAHGQPYCCSGS